MSYFLWFTSWNVLSFYKVKEREMKNLDLQSIWENSLIHQDVFSEDLFKELITRWSVFEETVISLWSMMIRRKKEVDSFTFINSCFHFWVNKLAITFELINLLSVILEYHHKSLPSSSQGLTNTKSTSSEFQYLDGLSSILVSL